MRKLNPKIIKYLQEKLNQKENSIRTNISLLRRKQAGMTLNAVAHKYAMSFGYSVMRFLDKEDRATLSLPLEIPKKKIKNNSNKKTKKNYNKLISPKTPYSNIISFQNLVEDSQAYIWWIDKHFTHKGFSLLREGVENSKVSSIKILLSINSNMDFENFRNLFKRLQGELTKQNLSCRVICDKKIINQIHDRWFISKNFKFNVPTINSLYQGQYSEINKTKSNPPFQEWWDNSLDIIQDWNKIKNAKEKELNKN